MRPQIEESDYEVFQWTEAVKTCATSSEHREKANYLEYDANVSVGPLGAPLQIRFRRPWSSQVLGLQRVGQHLETAGLQEEEEEYDDV